MLELTARRVHIMNSYQYRKLGLDDAVLEKCTSLLVGALRGERIRTFSGRARHRGEVIALNR